MCRVESAKDFVRGKYNDNPKNLSHLIFELCILQFICIIYFRFGSQKPKNTKLKMKKNWQPSMPVVLGP